MVVRGNIFLVGLMGVGKSTIGRHLAELLRFRFFDSDHEIEHSSGARIPLIFAVEGEAGFRKRECAMIEKLSREHDAVIATGGGAVLSAANREIFRARGTTVYLEASLDTLYERTRRDRHRPLLQTPDPRATLAELLSVRAPLYLEVAHVTINTDRRAPPQVAREIVSKLNQMQTNEDAKA